MLPCLSFFVGHLFNPVFDFVALVLIAVLVLHVLRWFGLCCLVALLRLVVALVCPCVSGPVVQRSGDQQQSLTNRTKAGTISEIGPIRRATVSYSFDGSTQDIPADEVHGDLHPFVECDVTFPLHSALGARPSKAEASYDLPQNHMRLANSSSRLIGFNVVFLNRSSAAALSLKMTFTSTSWFWCFHDALTPCPSHCISGDPAASSRFFNIWQSSLPGVTYQRFLH